MDFATTFRRRLPVAAALAAMLAGPALAQQDEAAETPAEETPAAEAPAAEAPADETPADEAAAPSATTPSNPDEGEREVVMSTHGDWQIVCAEAGTPCVMRQVAVNAEGQPLLEVSIRRVETAIETPNGSADAVVIILAPLRVMLPPGVTIRVDSGEAVRAAFRACNPQACIVQEALPDVLLNSFKRGMTARMAIVGPNNQEIPVDVSLTGFTAAYNNLPQS